MIQSSMLIKDRKISTTAPWGTPEFAAHWFDDTDWKQLHGSHVVHLSSHSLTSMFSSLAKSFWWFTLSKAKSNTHVSSLFPSCSSDDMSEVSSTSWDSQLSFGWNSSRLGHTMLYPSIWCMRWVVILCSRTLLAMNVKLTGP